MPLIAIDQVRKSFGSNQVLKGVSFRCGTGRGHCHHRQERFGQEHVATLHQRLETIDSGAITVAGAHLADSELQLRALRLKVGMIFQQFNLFPHECGAQRDAVADGGEGRARRAPVNWPRKTWHGWVCLPGSTRIRISCPAGSSSAWRLRARWPCSRPPCCATRLPRRSIPRLVNEVLQVVRGLAADGMTLLMVTHEMRFARGVRPRGLHAPGARCMR
jgi:polar amino acid transport system ATP-binding protein